MNRIYRIGDKAIVMDPTHEFIPYLKSMNPDFRVESVKPLLGFQSVFSSNKKGDNFDKKMNETFRMLQSCTLCAWQCGKDLHKEIGKCGLSHQVSFFDPFIHIGEEAVINPAVMVNFPLCSMDCVYCIRKDMGNEKLRSFDISYFWKKVLELGKQYPDINTLEFGGGDPALYVPWILQALHEKPEEISYPIVWNCNLFATPYAYELLEGVVDVYMPDLRYGNDSCAQRLSGVDYYWEHAAKGIEAIVKQKEARIIVRILILPNHFDCCYRKMFEFLSDYRDRLWISILEQYIPVHKAKFHRDINRRPTEDEINQVKTLAGKYGLRDVNQQPETFWRD
jgi:putative pyruvate formate lyase activating enzyme